MKPKTIQIKIESGIPMEEGYKHGEAYQLREQMKKMKVGDSFVYHSQNAPGTAARRIKIKVSSRKLNGEGYRIWRIK